MGSPAQRRYTKRQSQRRVHAWDNENCIFFERQPRTTPEDRLNLLPGVSYRRAFLWTNADAVRKQVWNTLPAMAAHRQAAGSTSFTPRLPW